MRNYIYSDLALESNYARQMSLNGAPEFNRSERGGITVLSLTIDNEELSKKYQRPVGKYVTLNTGKIWLMSESELEDAAEVIGEEIRDMINSLVKKSKGEKLSVLVVGLGNADVTPDAIGPLTVSHLTVTRHIVTIAPELFEKIGQCTVSAFTPGVLAQTGIETLELIRGAVENVSPDVVIAVDALAARSCERLATTIQLSDTGISPGSGIGNQRKSINQKNLGVPVIAVGVPTVVDSATLVCDSLERAGMTDIPAELEEVLRNGKDFFVSPKECDVISDSVGLLLARSLDRAFCVC